MVVATGAGDEGPDPAAESGEHYQGYDPACRGKLPESSGALGSHSDAEGDELSQLGRNTELIGSGAGHRRDGVPENRAEEK